MASRSAPTPPQQPSALAPKAGANQNEIPTRSELSAIATKSLQTGVLTAALGAVLGYGSGIVRNAPPALFAAFAGFQWFTLGSSFVASRSLLHHAWGGEENLTPMNRVQASAGAGAVSGMVGGLIRGPRNIIPGMIFFSALGGGVTFLSQQFQNREQKEKSGFLSSKWSPFRPISEQEYVDILEEKILKIDAEISIIDDNIAALKATQQPADSKEKPSSASK